MERATPAAPVALQLTPYGTPEEATAFPLRVTDLKQWFYCPRVPYWSHLAPPGRRLPWKVTHGAEQHAELERLEARRTLRAYGLHEGERRFRVRLFSERWQLSGMLDALVTTATERVPVEYKDTLGGLRRNHRLQLAAYALLLEETPGPPVYRGLMFSIPEGRARSVRLDGALQKEVLEALTQLRRHMLSEQLPPPADSWARCRDCEYFLLCGDRYPPSRAEATESLRRR
jgi:CRISPR-associated exonuclease Cas4